MARRRLAPPPTSSLVIPPPVPRAERIPERPLATAPIAHVAGESAALSAFEEVAETLRNAREGGRMILDLPLDQIAADHLLRDRLPAEDEEMAALRTSIRTHGQRTPIEVTPLTGPLPYGLISGWRRLVALQTLYAEAGEARFASVRAIVTRPETAGAAYVAMVEENEIRVGLSQYERARIVVMAASRGIFSDEEVALQALFGTSSKAKLSRIRSFIRLYRALDGALKFPQALSERLGLKLVECINAGEGDRLAAALAEAAPTDPKTEVALLEHLSATGKASPPRPAPEEILPGVNLAMRSGNGRLTLTLTGSGVTPELASRVRHLFTELAFRR
jgi:ParB family transcriptional regulator, chromosome partitioning protein